MDRTTREAGISREVNPAQIAGRVDAVSAPARVVSSTMPARGRNDNPSTSVAIENKITRARVTLGALDASGATTCFSTHDASTRNAESSDDMEAPSNATMNMAPNQEGNRPCS